MIEAAIALPKVIALEKTNRERNITREWETFWAVAEGMKTISERVQFVAI